MERISISPIRMSLAESPKALPTSLAWNRKFFLFLFFTWDYTLLPLLSGYICMSSSPSG